MKTSKRIAILAAASSLTLTLTPAMVNAEPVATPQIAGGHSAGSLGVSIDAAFPVGSVNTSPAGIADAAQAAGLTPSQSGELSRVVEGNPAFGSIIGDAIWRFRGAINQLIAFIVGLFPGLPGFPPPTAPPAPTSTLPPIPTTTATLPPIPTTTATQPTPTLPPIPTTTATQPTPTLPPIPTTTKTTPRPTVTATTPTPTPTPTATGTQPAPTIPPQGCGVRSSATNPDAFAQGVFELINDYRRANGRKALVRNLDLERTAKDWSDVMARTGVPAHNPNLRNQVPNCTKISGENIAAGTGAHSPQRMFDNWRNSPGHNENLLRPEFTDLGIGISTSGIWTYGTMVGAS